MRAPYRWSAYVLRTRGMIKLTVAPIVLPCRLFVARDVGRWLLVSWMLTRSNSPTGNCGELPETRLPTELAVWRLEAHETVDGGAVENTALGSPVLR